jgi:SAM-dependent methyltransferase
MYLRERIQRLPVGLFVEIGPGRGEITQLLLDHGWSGCSYDLEEKTVERLKVRFSQEIVEQRFRPINNDFISSQPLVGFEKIDLAISSMVMEHLNDDAQLAFMKKTESILINNGLMIALVPASPTHWGIEDDIAGHCRRYTRHSIEDLLATTGWKSLHIAGLTFPLSNLLLPVSNYLVNRSERKKLALSTMERTKQSGMRLVKYKTYFPSVLQIFLNKYMLFPAHIIQKIFSNAERSLVIYFEAYPEQNGKINE